MTGIWTAPPSAEANRRRRRAAGTTLLAGSLVVAGAMLVPSIFSFLGPTTEEGVTAHSRPITVLRVQADSGSLTVIPTSGEYPEVMMRSTWDDEQPVVSQQWNGSTLTVVTDCSGTGLCEVDLTVSIPAGVDVTARTGTGDLRLSGLSGAVDISTDTGDVDLSGLSGRVTAGTGTGDLTGEDLGSPWISTTTGTGELSLEFGTAPDTVSAVVGTGDLKIELPESSGGYRVDASTGTGEREVEVPQDDDASRRIHAQVETGDVTVEAD